MNDLMAAVAVWLSATYGLPEMAEPPRVRHFPAEQLSAMHFGRLDMTGIDDVVAIYDRDTKTIALRPDWSPADPIDLSVLVHEMVHHLQHQEGGVHACPQEREALAYQAQEAWLALTSGETLQTAFGLDPFSIVFKTRCVPY